LRARWWDAGEVYASDLIYETSPLGGCRSQGLPWLGLAVRAHAGGARPPFRGRNLRSSSGSSIGRISKGRVGKRFEGEKGAKEEKDKKKMKRAKTKSGEEKKSKKTKVSEQKKATRIEGRLFEIGRSGLGQVSRNPNDR